MLQQLAARQRWCSMLVLALFGLLLLAPGQAKADSGDLYISDFGYGDPYIAVTYYGYNDDVKIIAYAGTASKPGTKTKTYKATYNAANDEYRIKMPDRWKIGAKFTIRCTSVDDDTGLTVTDTARGKVKAPEDVSYEFWYITEKQKSVKVKVNNVHKGDKIKMKIGKKTYTKVMPKDYKKKTFKVKVKKSKAGTKMTVWLVNKYNQKIASKDSSVIYKYTKVKIGMTKKQAKLAIGWRYPDDINKTAYTEQWCYDDDGDGYSDSFLYFRNGKVSNWQIL